MAPIGGTFAKDGFGNRARQRLGLFHEAEQRQDDQEIGEIVDREQARREHITALRRLRAKPAKDEADQHEDPKNWRKSGRYRPERTREVSSHGRNARITIDAPSAATPKSLFGIARRIA